MAHAAQTSLVTVERIRDDLAARRRGRRRRARCRRSMSARSPMSRGRAPVRLRGDAIRPTTAEIARYAEVAATQAGFAACSTASSAPPAFVERERRERLIERWRMSSRRGARRRRRVLAAPGRRGAAARASARGGRRGLDARQRAPQLLHRRRPRAVRLRGAGPHRRLFPRRRPDRRRGQHQPGGHRRLSALQLRWPGSFGSGLLYFARAARDPVPRGAQPARVRRQGRLRRAPPARAPPASTAPAAPTRS